MFFFFFFQAEDGIRYVAVTGVQTCALPIFTHHGLEEVYSSNDKTTTTWQPRARDPELEAEMLQRLLLRFEAADSATVAKTGGDKAVPKAPAATALPNVSHVIKEG